MHICSSSFLEPMQGHDLKVDEINLAVSVYVPGNYSLTNGFTEI